MVERTFKLPLIGLLILLLPFGITKLFAAQRSLLTQQILIDYKYFSITGEAKNKMKEIESLVDTHGLTPMALKRH